MLLRGCKPKTGVHDRLSGRSRGNPLTAHHAGRITESYTNGGRAWAPRISNPNARAANPSGVRDGPFLQRPDAIPPDQSHRPYRGGFYCSRLSQQRRSWLGDRLAPRRSDRSARLPCERASCGRRCNNVQGASPGNVRSAQSIDVHAVARHRHDRRARRQRRGRSPARIPGSRCRRKRRSWKLPPPGSTALTNSARSHIYELVHDSGGRHLGTFASTCLCREGTNDATFLGIVACQPQRQFVLAAHLRASRYGGQPPHGSCAEVGGAARI